MIQTEFLYSYSSIIIATALFFVMLMFNELGYRVGRFVQKHTDNELKTLTGSIQASVLGLLALMLGFTFSIAMQRYNDRSMALIEEANAIGTTMLRVRLLPAEYQEQINTLLEQYIDLRVEMGKVGLNDHGGYCHHP